MYFEEDGIEMVHFSRNKMLEARVKIYVVRLESDKVVKLTPIQWQLQTVDYLLVSTN